MLHLDTLHLVHLYSYDVTVYLEYPFVPENRTEHNINYKGNHVFKQCQHKSMCSHFYGAITSFT